VETKNCSSPECLSPTKPISEFHRNRSKVGGLQSQCKVCVRKWLSSDVGKNYHREYFRVWDVENWHARLFHSCTKRNKHRPESWLKNQKVTITKEWILEQYVRQAKKCYHTGVIMIPSEDPRNPFQPSLERLDNDVTYTPENTVLASWAANAARGSSSVEVFREWLKAVRSSTE